MCVLNLLPWKNKDRSELSELSDKLMSPLWALTYKGAQKEKTNKLRIQKELMFSQLFWKEIKRYWYHVKWVKFHPSDNIFHCLLWKSMTVNYIWSDIDWGSPYAWNGMTMTIVDIHVQYILLIIYNVTVIIKVEYKLLLTERA